MESISTTINRHTLEETAGQVVQGFPYRADYADLTKLPGGVFPWHWHHEVELFYMKRGALEYHLPNGTHFFDEGDVGFLNSDVLHQTRSVPGRPCQQQEHIFLPSLVGGEYGSQMYTRYVTPLVAQRQNDILLFGASTAQAQRLRGWMDKALQLYTEKPTGYELRIRALVSEMWLLVLEASPGQTPAPQSRDEERIKQMLSYIAQHYAESLSLEKIAAAAYIGSRECTRCFQRQMKLSPFEYLTDYRVSKACEALRKDNDSISAVAQRCGFGSSSYFGKVFRQATGMTPSAYRNGQTLKPEET